MEGAPYDRIIIDTPISVVDDSILNQLNENLGKLIIIRKINVNLCKAVSITKNKDSFSEDYLFDVFSEYELFKQQKVFKFWKFLLFFWSFFLIVVIAIH